MRVRRPPPAPSRSRRESAQATVELALCLPVLLLATLVVVQAAVVVRAQVVVAHAAGATARVVAVGGRADVQAVARRAAPGLEPGAVRARTMHLGGSPPLVAVTVVVRVHTDVPLVGPLVGDVTVSARAVMPEEPAL